jgi:peroxiredoxin Q/BCP
MLAPGTQAPAFTADDQDGNTVNLADQQGRWVLLWWYPKASTPG